MSLEDSLVWSPKGFRVLHDLGLPRSKANIDHLVIGPTGVLAVDTKNYTGRVTWSKGTLWHGKSPISRAASALDRSSG